MVALDQNEIQMIRFWETNASATFTITFRENVTYPINCNDTLIALKYRLEQLYTLVLFFINCVIIEIIEINEGI